MIIGITGTISSGKDVVADYLVKKKGFDYFSHSDEIRQILAEDNIEPIRENLQKKGNELRQKFGPAYLSKRILKKVKGDAVIMSIRNLFEVEEFRKRLDFYFVAVDAPVEKRFNWSQKRGRAGDGQTFNEFIKAEEIENSKAKNSQNLSSCIKKADLLIINDGTLEDLNKKAEQVYLKAKEKIGQK